jgi:hypothetical protein
MTGGRRHARFYFHLTRKYGLCLIDASVKFALALLNL